jgi:IclR family transcriptional regulator, acetate operon repressor
VSGRYKVPAVSSAIRILGELAQVDGNGASQSDLVRETGISKSTMHNLLATLESGGFVRRSSSTGRYQLGGALIPLGAAAALNVRSLTLAIERLPGLAREHGLSMAVGQLTPNRDAQIIERVYPPQPVHVGIRLGSRYGYFDGAIGKCLLATLAPADAEKLVRDRPIPAHTELTLTDPETLLEDVAQVRARGWGASIGEYNSNIAVSATIAGADGVEGLLLALGFPNDLSPAMVPSIGVTLREVADSITAQAGGTPPNGGRRGHRTDALRFTQNAQESG